MGEIVELPEVGGLHHRYECRAAWTTQTCSIEMKRLLNQFD
jgi:hypothetical protein